MASPLGSTYNPMFAYHKRHCQCCHTAHHQFAEDPASRLLFGGAEILDGAGGGDSNAEFDLQKVQAALNAAIAVKIASTNLPAKKYPTVGDMLNGFPDMSYVGWIHSKHKEWLKVCTWHASGY